MSDKVAFHYVGTIHGCVPVYVDDVERVAPLVVVRHWSLLPWLYVVETCFQAVSFVTTWLWPGFEPYFLFKVKKLREPVYR